MNGVARDLIRYFAVVVLLALSFGCATSDPAASYASDPEFRALANQVCEMINSTSGEWKTVKAQQQDPVARGPSITNSHHSYRYFNAKVDGRGIMRFNAEEILKSEVKSPSGARVPGSLYSIDKHSYKVPVHLLEADPNQGLARMTDKGSLGNLSVYGDEGGKWGKSAEEWTYDDYTVYLTSQHGDHLWHYDDSMDQGGSEPFHSEGWHSPEQSEKILMTIDFRSEQQARNFLNALNRLIAMAKAKYAAAAPQTGN